MIYLHTDPENPARSFLYHYPTHTLAEHFITLNGNHHLRVHQDGPIDTEALIDLIDYLEKRSDFQERIHLTTMSGKVDYSTLPPHIILVHATEPEALIHYPAIGFTAGLRMDGTKIPPHWRNPSLLCKEQRSHFLHNAADTLMHAIAKYKK